MIQFYCGKSLLNYPLNMILLPHRTQTPCTFPPPFILSLRVYLIPLPLLMSHTYFLMPQSHYKLWKHLKIAETVSITFSVFFSSYTHTHTLPHCLVEKLLFYSGSPEIIRSFLLISMKLSSDFHIVFHTEYFLSFVCVASFANDKMSAQAHHFFISFIMKWNHLDERKNILLSHTFKKKYSFYYT